MKQVFLLVFFLNLCICSFNPVDLNQRFPLCTDPALFISSEMIEDLIKYEGICIKVKGRNCQWAAPQTEHLIGHCLLYFSK